jgi:F0F1-type ATP synthase assembly protein I
LLAVVVVAQSVMGLFSWAVSQRRRARGYRDLDAVARDRDAKAARQATRIHVYALELPMSVIVGAVLGAWADRSLDIAPWGITVGLIAGVGAAVRSIIRLIDYQKQLS